MSDDLRVFELRLEGRIGEPENLLVEVSCERLHEDGWAPYTVQMNGPAFGTFVYAAFLCQVSYLRTNACERGLGLDRVRGHFRMTTQGWVVQEIDAELWMHVRSGTPTEEDRAFITERMRDCPVSRNLAGARKRTVLHVA